MISIKTPLRIFILLSIVYLSAVILDAATVLFYLKPVLLLPLIVVAFISKNFQNKIILAIALAFSCIGDTLLLFVFKDAVYFILGLVAFLSAHIFYIILFSKELKKANGKIELRKAVLIPVVIYLITLLMILIPTFGQLNRSRDYSVVISTMLYMACLLSFHWPKPYSFYLFTGAISFILSDSILAFDKFYQPVPMSGFLIMATYLYAQGALVKSCLK